MIRLIPPVAVPVTATQVASSLVRRSSETSRSFAADLAANAGVARVELFGSGRAALAAWLGCHATDSRDEVAVPAYTCWSVAASVVSAGLRVRLVDVDPATLDFDAEALAQLPVARLAAAIPAHLFTRSCDVGAVCAAIRRRDPAVGILEDAAQAWPASEPSPADAVLLSFGRGKPLPLGGGGALLHNGDRVASVGTRRGGWGQAASLALTSMLARPRWYRIPESMPFLAIGATVYDPTFDTERPFRVWQERLGARLLARLPDLQQRRERNARRLAALVQECPGWTVPAARSMQSPLRLPLMATDRRSRDETVGALRRRGVAASTMYPGTLGDIPELRAHLIDASAVFPGATEVANRLLTLPVYPTLSARQVDLVAAAFRAATRGAAR